MYFIKVDNDKKGIELLSYIDTASFNLAWTSAQWRNEVENPNNHVFLIYEDEELLIPVGFISYGISGYDIELKKIAILPQYRKMKYASMAIEKMIEDGRSEGIQNIIVEVAITNLPAIRLYEKYSFYKIHIRKKYYDNLVDAIVMQKEV